ncbi:MAG: thioredoxin family protein [Thermodesulfobacteriota bacterium]
MESGQDAPLQRTLRVGKATVGLIGLDLALNRVLADGTGSAAELAEAVYAEIAAKNYVPQAASGLYREAIAAEIMRLRGETAGDPGHLVIRVLGHGCVACNNLQKQVIEIMADMGVAADVFQVHDPDEIGRFGVLHSPALVINGQLKCQGNFPTRAQVEEWLREYLPEE